MGCRNDAALLSYCRDLDDIEDRGKRLELALRGVFAGNVFDLGAQGTADMFENGEGLTAEQHHAP